MARLKCSGCELMETKKALDNNQKTVSGCSVSGQYVGKDNNCEVSHEKIALIIKQLSSELSARLAE